MAPVMAGVASGRNPGGYEMRLLAGGRSTNSGCDATRVRVIEVHTAGTDMGSGNPLYGGLFARGIGSI